MSVDVLVDEVWTLNCTAPSTHSFTFNNSIAITNAHVSDPNTGQQQRLHLAVAWT